MTVDTTNANASTQVLQFTEYLVSMKIQLFFQSKWSLFVDWVMMCLFFRVQPSLSAKVEISF